MLPQSNRLTEGEEEMAVSNPSQNYSESQRISSQGGGQRRPRRLGNELLNATITRRQMDMLEVLRDYDIRGPERLQDLLEDNIVDSDDRRQLNIRGATAFAGASRFSIRGGDFVVAGRDLHTTRTYDGQARGPRLEQTRVEQTMLVESTRSPPGYSQIEAERTSHLQQRIVGQPADATHDMELPIEDEDEMQESESGPPYAALVAYDSPGYSARKPPKKSPRNKPPRTAIKGAARRKSAAEAEREVDESNDYEDGSEEEAKEKRSKPAPRKGKRQGKSKGYDSDALDDDSDFGASDDNDEEEQAKPAKRKRSNGKAKTTKTPSPRKKRRKADEDQQDDFELEEVPPGQISQNSIDFLQNLADPDRNDRQWFKLHEPVFRLAEKEFKDFIESFTEVLSEVDPHVPILPPKDVIHRIYRDIRFSNDKTPYKRNFCASLSRSGRKGIFACYHISSEYGLSTFLSSSNYLSQYNPMDRAFSLLELGAQEKMNWRPFGASNLARSSGRLRQVISEPEFVKLFGEPKPKKNGGRSSIFGREDELKVAPKGFDKDHKDIDLLKLRTFAIMHRFQDSEVLDPDFKTKLGQVAAVARPFVRCLNDLMTLPDADADDEGGDEDENEEETEEH
ncbi:hypothetical protein D9757_011960 [Collybiopsis confluens]|uniref:Uncharacterized protein n=1 Tax=Collybiopsis confluens TaxID=2823264 RepID=A0A8H5GGB9_9AGAR|nr:hypothetical protein D9757_011960 [Collybiopsis confluens]